MKKLILLALPCLVFLSACGGNGGGGYSNYETTSSSGYANFSSSDSGYSSSNSKYGSDYSQAYSTSARESAPFGNYPVNSTAKAHG